MNKKTSENLVESTENEKSKKQNHKFTESFIKSLVWSDFGKNKDFHDSARPGLILRLTKNQKTFYHGYKRRMTRIGIYASDVNQQGYYSISDARKYVSEQRAIGDTSKPGHYAVSLKTYLEKQYVSDYFSVHKKPVSQKNIKDLLRYFSNATGFLHHFNMKVYDNFVESNLHLKENSVRKVYYSLRVLFDVLVSLKKLNKNPIDKNLKYSASSDRSINVFSVNVNDVYEAVFDPDFGKPTNFSKGYSFQVKLMTCLIIDTGCRPSEMRINTYENFILSETDPIVHINSSMTKTKKSRVVPISSDFLIEKLRFYVEHLHIKNKQGYMFINPTTGKVYELGFYRAIWREIKKQFKLRGRFYDWRHTFATYVYNKTGDIKLVADLIGDAVETASKYYAKSSTQEARKRISGRA